MKLYKLSEAFDVIRNGKSIKQAGEDGFPITRIETIADGTIDVNRMGYAGIQQLDDHADYLLRNGDILMSHINSEKHLGKIAIFDLDLEVIHGMNLLCLRGNPEKLVAKYAFYFFNSDLFKRQLPQITNKSVNQASFNVTKLKNLDIPLPSLPIQKKIVEVLDKAQELIDLRKKQLGLLDELVQSVFYEMFGDPVTNPKGWEVRCLKEFYSEGDKSIKCGPFGSALKKSEYVPSGIPVWNMDNISKSRFVNVPSLFVNQEKFLELKGYSVINGDIIISRAGTVGKMCEVITDYERSIISTNLIRLRLNELLTPRYFVSVMTYCGAKICKLKTGDVDAFSHMNTGVLDSIYLPAPPLDLQKHFINAVRDIEVQKSLMQSSLTEMENTFNSLMQQAFSGELF